MKKLLLFLVIVTLNSCESINDGEQIKVIEYNKYYEQCFYYTSTLPFSDHVIAPCNLYKVGDTLRLK